MLIVALNSKISMRKKERVKITVGDEQIFIYVKRECGKNKVGVEASDAVGIHRQYMVNGVWKTKGKKSEGNKKE